MSEEYFALPAELFDEHKDCRERITELQSELTELREAVKWHFEANVLLAQMMRYSVNRKDLEGVTDTDKKHAQVLLRTLEGE